MKRNPGHTPIDQNNPLVKNCGRPHPQQFCVCDLCKAARDSGQKPKADPFTMLVRKL